MRLLTRARLQGPRAPRAKRAADFDRAVAEFFMRRALEEAREGPGAHQPQPGGGRGAGEGRPGGRARLPPEGRHRARRGGGAGGRRGARPRRGPLHHAGALRPLRAHPAVQPGHPRGRRAPRRLRLRGPQPAGERARASRGCGAPAWRCSPGVLKDEADRLNRPFFKVMTDGPALRDAEGGRHARRQARHRHRRLALGDRRGGARVGAPAARPGGRDPGRREHGARWTTRSSPRGCPAAGGKDPVRIVVDSRLRLDPGYRVFTQRSRGAHRGRHAGGRRRPQGPALPGRGRRGVDACARRRGAWT